ncbi:MAG: hypothetical protein ACK4GC_01985 [Paracoccaceae bacterium]
MTIPDFTITKLRILDGPPNDHGRRLLATFSLQVSGLVVTGCCLSESAEGIARAQGPIGKTAKGHSAVTTFHDPAVFRAITRRAAQAYSALTGRELSDD